MPKIKIFTPKPFPGLLIQPDFYFRFAPEQASGNIFAKAEHSFFKNALVETPEAADVIVLPNNFVKTPDIETEAYINKYADLAQKLGKDIYLFSCGDLTDDLTFDPRAKVFRYSMYKSSAHPEDICIPTLTEDLGREGILFRKKEILPIVSFCGKADFASTREWIATLTRMLKYQLIGIIRPLARARIRGVYWRMWMLKTCEHSSLVKTLFIIRKTFSGARSTIELSPEDARKDFIRSIKESDFVLAPKGDGNYSNRFLEALSMGRIPVLVDTDVVLPLEGLIDYSKVVVRVPMRKISKTPQYIKEFYDALSEEEWTARQKLARDIYIKYLYQDTFFETYFLKNTSHV